MIGRCENKSTPQFKNYGGRGIRVCLRWRLDFLAFIEDMGKRPTPAHSLDRINNDGNYEPGNCRWATVTEQLENRRVTKWVELDGVRMPQARAAAALGTSDTVLARYLRLGLSTAQIRQRLLLPGNKRPRSPRRPNTTSSKQLRFLSFLAAELLADALPSLRALTERAGLRYDNSVRGFIEKLSRSGLIEEVDGPRRYAITELGRAALARWSGEQ